MNEIEAGRMLLMAISLDPKMPQPDDAGFIRRVWGKALHDVPADAGKAAVVAYYRSDHYAQTRETISPADIVQWWNARRRPTESERAGVPATSRRALPAPPPDPDRIMAGVALCRSTLAVAKGVKPDVAEGDAAATRLLRSVTCPHCHAQPGERCTGLHGAPLTKTEAHPSRIAAAHGRHVAVTPRKPPAADQEPTVPPPSAATSEPEGRS